MNESLPDRVVIAVIALTVVLVLAVAFSLKPRSDQESPFLWRDPSPAPPAQVISPLSRGTLARGSLAKGSLAKGTMAI
ncbi:hypothetical protein MITS9509_01230 [Synechococcus sp. MIT S9509]|uniref:hypothetical protein n=1 Tax=unclassified Synechococcus TaxID=2626047 RepID=UPI0007BB96CF|nr:MULTISPECIES: hypothetical protein [unclassified Synechococcus]KZR87379.1 hypothetical protein MITS9504_00795 [Synechococcus sp. MIT S9504]KZR92781.1 hypothetical protein MITS9509_01230 [Synechococcus sp. MIT S9509]